LKKGQNWEKNLKSPQRIRRTIILTLCALWALCEKSQKLSANMKNSLKIELNMNRIEILKFRSALLNEIRQWFIQEGYTEVTTPLCVPYCSGEAYIEPYSVEFRDDRKNTYSGYLISSPEMYMKRLLAEGFKKIFQICPCYRSGESFTSPLHNPEFTMVEWYQMECDLNQSIKITKNLFDHAKQFAQHFFPEKNKNQELSGSDKSLSKFSVQELFNAWTNIDFSKFDTWNDICNAATKKGYPPGLSPDNAFYTIFLNEIEPHFDKNTPFFVYNYPEFQAAWAKCISIGRLQYGCRYELYYNGVELANGYEELCSSQDQKKRFNNDQKIRDIEGRPVYEPDSEFIECVDKISGSSGTALGFDRLAMLLCGASAIQDVIAFPAGKLFK